MFRGSRRIGFLVLFVAVCLAPGCSEESAEDSRGGPPGGHGSRGQRGPGGGEHGGPPGAAASVPVEVVPVARREISSYIETNGVLEAENEVDLVARTAAPIVELLVEEGMEVGKGQPLVRLDDEELRADLEISKVALNDATLTYERAKELSRSNLISEEEYEEAKASFETARAQLDATRIQLSYTDVRAPFGGMIITRYVDNAQQVSVNTPLFRLSDFEPLLCPIQVPERELAKLHVGQRAYLTVESWPGERFDATVLRVSPVVDAATGTIKVTLEVRSPEKLRPGMFARVFVETDTRSDALVIPKAALSLESIGDTVYVADGDVAARREVELGFREGDFVEIVSGLAGDESIVVIGQDGLSDGTPIQILGGARQTQPAGAMAQGGPHPEAAPEGGSARPEPGQGGEHRGGPGRGGFGGGPPDFASMTPEQLERIKERMRSRGMTDEQIEERIKRARESSETAGQ